MIPKLSVNINKIATLRNSRGEDMPNVVKCAIDCELFGAEGITVHPRPDERHITYKDVRDLSEVIKTEFNIEGYPSEDFINLVLETKPTQVTLVPDAPDAITSNAGWDTIKNREFLTDVIAQFKAYNIRTSIFVGTDIKMIEGAATVGTDRVELYTEPYASQFRGNKESAVAPFREAAKAAKELNLGVNAGHDLNMQNLSHFCLEIPELDEVSIGHALIADALYLGLELTVLEYKERIKGRA